MLACVLTASLSCSRRGHEQGTSPGAATRQEQIGSDPRVYGVTAVDGTSSVAELYRDASARLDKGDIKGARALYQKALGEEPENAQGHVGLGACAVHEQDLEAARASYRRALELEPKASLAHIGLGSVAYLQSRFREAADHYEAALEIDDAMADAHWGAAVAYEALGDAAKKRAHAGRFLALAPDSALASSAKAMLSEAR